MSTTHGHQLVARALLDQESEASFVSESLVQRLRLPRSSASVTVTGIGARSVVRSRGRLEIELLSLSDSNVKVKFEALVLPRLSSYTPSAHLTVSRWQHLVGLVLADPEFSSPSRIEILLDADVFSRLRLPGCQRAPEDAPVAQNTHLGWISSGSVMTPGGAYSAQTSLQLAIDHSLLFLLQRFWEQEENSTPLIPLTSEELECEDHFVKIHSRDSTGS